MRAPISSETYRRPPIERALRWALAKVLPYPGRFRLAVRAANLGRPFAGLMPKQVRAMLELRPRALPPRAGWTSRRSSRPRARGGSGWRC